MPTSVAHDLGVWFDSDFRLTTSTHITKTVVDCSLFCVNYTQHLSFADILTRLVVNLVFTRLDYCNSVLAGLPSSQLNRLQSVINVAVRLVRSGHQSDHITPLLTDLRWLRIPDRIELKLCTLAYCCVNGIARPYLADSVQRVSDIEAGRQLHSAVTGKLTVAAT